MMFRSPHSDLAAAIVAAITLAPHCVGHLVATGTTPQGIGHGVDNRTAPHPDAVLGRATVSATGRVVVAGRSSV
jgi:hypothetical protein